MHVATCRIALRLPENDNLKGKRAVIGSLSSRIRSKFNVSVAEVGEQEAWQIASMGIAAVSNSARHSEEVIDHIIGFIEETRPDVEIIEIERETLSGF
jgi:hypothetical protein